MLGPCWQRTTVLVGSEKTMPSQSLPRSSMGSSFGMRPLLRTICDYKLTARGSGYGGIWWRFVFMVTGGADQPGSAKGLEERETARHPRGKRRIDREAAPP